LKIVTAAHSESRRRLLVGVVELLAARLIGQVEVAVGLAPNDDRNAKEAVHGRVARWEAVGAGVVADIAQPQRDWVASQLTQHTAAARRLADRRAGLVVDSGVDEPFQFVAILIEDAEGGVPRPRQLAGDVDDLAQHGVEVELGDEATADVD